MNQESDLAALQRQIGHSFVDERLLRQALVHRSYLHENLSFPMPSNERLEFLGDALLNYAVAAHLYRLFPEETEGTLTKLRAGVVQRDTLARVARGLDLGSHLLMGRGEEHTGGRERASNLAHLYEAVVGALLLDAGQQAAEAYVLVTLRDATRDVVAGTLGADYKSELQEFCQARKWDAPLYRITTEEGPPHARHFQVEVVVQGESLGRGAGPSRQRAEKEAARNALSALQLQEGAG